MKKILILGSSGLLGSELTSGEYFKEYNIITQSLKSKSDFKINLEDYNQVVKLFKETKPNIVLNLVGLTNVDHCEKFPNEAYKLNTKTVQNIVNAIKKHVLNSYLIHISTDQVYDDEGFCKENKINLLNYYAFSKFCGELFANQTSSTILRTNFFGKSKCNTRKSLTDWIYEELMIGNTINVFDDIKFNPLSIKNLCKMIELVSNKKISGTFNLGAKDGMTKANFALYFAKSLNLKTTNINFIKVANAKFLNAYRPKDMMINSNKFEKYFGIQLPKLADEIKLISKEYLK